MESTSSLPTHPRLPDLTTMKTKYIDRFWSRVEKTDSCWLWKAALQSAGYGVMRINCKNGNPGEMVYAHRFSYELLKGPIKGGLEIDHLCRVRNCVNPDHLEPVTGTENWRRGFSASANNARKESCIYGHPFSGDNLYLRPDTGTRQCLICKREYFKEWDEKRKRVKNSQSQSLETV